MGYFNFENDKTALNDTNLNKMQKGLMELVFPIGSTYITQANTNPNTILGFGTWERLKGKVCLGLDEDDMDLNSIGRTGGEKKHTLSIEEMPSHQHKLNFDGGDTMAVMTNSKQTNDVDQHSGGYWTYDAVSMYTTFVGGGQAHNNMQPYEVVGYMWIRRS